MTPEILSGVAALIVSLLFSYFPKLNTWYAAQETASKKLVMLGLTFLVAVSTFGLSCAGYLSKLFDVQLACSEDGVILLFRVFFAAVVSNQIGYALTPTAGAVKEVKDAAEGSADLRMGAG